MDFGETLVAVIAIVSVAGVLRTLLGGGRRHHERMMRSMPHLMQAPPQSDPDAARLRDEVRSLKERVAVLERLITDQSSALDREFDKLKAMD